MRHAGSTPNDPQVTLVNADWDAGAPGEDGSFSLLLVDEDGNRHTVQPNAAAMTALVALTQAGTVLLWDPDGGILVASNVFGQWLPSTWSAPERERR